MLVFPPLLFTLVTVLGSAPGVSLPLFEAGGSVLVTTTPAALVGPSLRVSLEQDTLLVSGSLDWPIALVGSRALVLAGAGLRRPLPKGFTVYGLGLAGLDALSGPPVGLSPAFGLRGGATWQPVEASPVRLGLAVTASYDLAAAWGPADRRLGGLAFWVALTAAFEVGR